MSQQERAIEPEHILIERHIQRLIEKRGGRGKLLPLLFDLSPRLQWWSLVMMTKQILPIPWPKLKFADRDFGPPLKVIERCLKQGPQNFDTFLDWILFALGFPQAREPRAEQNLLEHFESTFELPPFVEFPGDSLGHYFETHVCSPSLAQRGGVFFTPQNLCDMIVELQKPDLLQSVLEPSAGSGRLLLSASNYSLLLHAQEIHPTVFKVLCANAMLYMPSMVFPVKEIAAAGAITLDRKLINNLRRTHGQRENPQDCSWSNDPH